ncbi:unnamed protein product [Camellia sinensis]
MAFPLLLSFQWLSPSLIFDFGFSSDPSHKMSSVYGARLTTFEDSEKEIILFKSQSITQEISHGGYFAEEKQHRRYLWR